MNNVARRVTSNFIWLLLSDVFSGGAIFLGNLYIARVLKTAEFGIFSFALAVSNYMWIAVDLGITLYGTREVAKKPDEAEEILSVLNSMRFFTSIVVFSLLFLALTMAHVPPHRESVLLAAGFYVIAYALSPDWLFRGSETMKYLAIGDIITGSFFLSSILFLVRGPENTTWAAFLWSFSTLVGSIGTLYLLWKKLDIRFFFTFSLSKWKGHIRESVYFALIASLMRGYAYIPILLLGFLSTPDQVGIFSAPHRFVYMLNRFNFVFPRAFYPVLASLVGDIKAFKEANYSLQKIMMAIGLPIGVGGTILARDIIHLLYGSSYIGSTDVFKVLIWVVPIGFVRSSYSNPLLALGLQRLNALATGLSVFITVILNIVLIPIYGIYGAAIACVACEVMILFFMTLIFSKRVYRSIPLDAYFFKIFIACVLMGVVIGIVNVNVVVKVILGALSYGVLAIALGITDRKAILGFYSTVVNKRKKV